MPSLPARMSADGVVGLLSALGEVSATSLPGGMPSAADRPRLAALGRMVEVLLNNLFRIQVRRHSIDGGCMGWMG